MKGKKEELFCLISSEILMYLFLTTQNLEKENLQSAFLDVEITTVESSTSSQDYAEKILAKKLRSSDDSVIQCLDWLPVTSNIAERLFSQTKRVFLQYRKRLLPRHLEMQLFLMINENFWTVETVSKICQRKIQ